MSEVKNHPISGGKAVVECLKAHNIKYVFGLIGSATMELFDALYDEKSIHFIDVRDERTGTHMADAFARASGSTGVIIAGQNGPGATNLVTGVAQAKAAFSPLLSIAGAIATEHQGKDAFQEVDQQKLFEPITKKTFSIQNTKSITKKMNEAIVLSKNGKWGPVHVNIPRDVLAGIESFDSFKNEMKTENKHIDKNDLEKIVSLIENAKKPVIICVMEEKYLKNYYEILKSLRDDCINSEIFLDSKKNLGKQLTYANKKKCPVAIICGENEFQNNTITLKYLLGVKGENNQTTFPKENLINEIKKFI